MAKVRIYPVRGIGPLGQVMELNLVADTALDAEVQAAAAGMRDVIVGAAQDCEDFEDTPQSD